MVIEPQQHPLPVCVPCAACVSVSDWLSTGSTDRAGLQEAVEAAAGATVGALALALSLCGVPLLQGGLREGVVVGLVQVEGG